MLLQALDCWTARLHLFQRLLVLPLLLLLIIILIILLFLLLLLLLLLVLVLSFLVNLLPANSPELFQLGLLMDAALRPRHNSSVVAQAKGTQAGDGHCPAAKKRPKMG